MPSRKEIQWSQLRVGALVLAALAVLVFVILLMSSASGGLFSHKLTLRTYFPNAGGLKAGAPVTLEGVTIGNISKIRVVPERAPSPVEITMRVGGNEIKFLHTDSTASIVQAGVLGDAFVDITSMNARGPEPGNNQELRSVNAPSLQGVISARMLARAWGFLGLISATLVMAGFFLTLRHAGWHPGASTGSGTPLNHAYRQATTVAWLGIVACQVGTAFAVRTEHASLRQVGVFTNKLLLAGIAVALAFAAALVYLPALHGFFGTAALSPGQLATVAPYPFIVWGADEIRRALVRRRAAKEGLHGTR